MSINTQNYTDSKGAQAHLGFQLLIFLDLLSKDSINTSQSISTFFMAVAIPSLIILLTLAPNKDGDIRQIKSWHFKTAALAFLVGHGFGLLSITSIIWGFNSYAGVAFLLSSLTAYIIFCFHYLHAIGDKGVDEIEKLLGGDSNKSDLQHSETNQGELKVNHE